MASMATKRLVLALALVVALGSAASRSLRAGGDPAPAASTFDVSAERLDLDVQAKTAVLSGNVKLSKGGITVSCPRVDARYDDVPQITWAKGSGGVVAELNGARAEAPEVEIDMPSQTMELRGGVRLSRGGGWIKAEKATIHMATSKITMSDVKGSIPVGKPLPAGAPSSAPIPPAR
jgi:lipopolysaccharide export system protein LptA